MTAYFRLTPNREAIEPTTDDWDARNLAQLSCRACGCLLCRDRPIDVILKYAHLKVPLNSIGAAEVGIIRSDLIKAIGGELLSTYFQLGMAINYRNNSPADCKSFVSPRPIELRGDKTSAFRYCEKCANPVYFPLGDRYLLTNDVAKLLPLYEGRPSIIVFREDIMERVAATSLEFQFIEIPVRDDPLDGLPLDLRDAPKDLIMNQWQPRKKRDRRVK